MEKKAVSTVLATIILILVLMTIVSIVVVFSNNFFGLLERDSTIHSPLYQKLKVTMESATINITGSGEKLTVIITREDNEDIPLEGVRFTVKDTNGNSYNYDVNEPPIEAGLSKSYVITNTDLGIDTLYGINKVSVSMIAPEGKQTVVLDERDI